MADVIKEFTFLDQAGVSTLTSSLLKQVNVKINDRAVSTLDASSDAYHFLTAAALFGLLGAADSTDAATVNGAINALEALVGTKADAAGTDTVYGAIKDVLATIGDEATATADDGTVYGDIKALAAEVAALTHLTIETYVGNVEDIADPQTDVLYFVKSDESDQTWELYIAQVDTDAGTTTWINVGDTSVDLANYYKHGDLQAMTDDAIKTAVATAYAESQDPTVVA